MTRYTIRKTNDDNYMIVERGNRYPITPYDIYATRQTAQRVIAWMTHDEQRSEAARREKIMQELDELDTALLARSYAIQRAHMHKRHGYNHAKAIAVQQARTANRQIVHLLRRLPERDAEQFRYDDRAINQLLNR